MENNFTLDKVLVYSLNMLKIEEFSTKKIFRKRNLMVLSTFYEFLNFRSY